MPSPFADTATRRDGRPLTPHPASYFLHAQSMRSQNLKRVKNVHYNVTYNPKDGKPKPADYVESTNEWDKWLR
jgi:hypothetical protein